MTVADRIAEDIRRHVLDRGLRPGERLPSERALAEQLGVSRPTLREGMRRLAGMGFVEMRRGAGNYVAPVRLHELLEVRLLLEPAAAALAAEKRSADEARALRDLVTELLAAIADARRCVALDAELHQLIAVASGNEILERVLAGLGDLTSASRAQTAGQVDVRRDNARSMKAIVDAIDARDALAARAAMRRHLRRAQRSLPPAGPEAEQQ